MAENRPTQKPTNDVMAQVVDKIKSSDNILVALSNNPSVDELAGAVGLTLMLDKIGKHATAIFSGQIPNALEFLEPEKTFESNTNSLQDFIIALNKDKADHLRYKIDGDYVKVFITPYRTTINESDLEFSHGDYNVGLVMALDVTQAGDLDGALSEHGRIMHDATVVNITTNAPGKFGDVQWSNPGASSVSEMIMMVAEGLRGKDAKGGNLLDTQVATALLTGIVAATDRFSNEKTTPLTMVMASRLMELGADQKLISANIAKILPATSESAEAPPVATQDASRLSVDHKASTPQEVMAEALAHTEGDKLTPTPPGDSQMADTHGAVEFVPSATTSLSPEEELEKIVQAPANDEARGPLMEELRQAASEEDLTGTLRDNMPKKDYGAIIEQELKEPMNGGVAGNSDSAMADGNNNPAVQAAPQVAGTPEINGVPAIDYEQAPEDSPTVIAPQVGEEAYLNTRPEMVMKPSAELVDEGVADSDGGSVAASVDSTVELAPPPLPMPGDAVIPPPPPPFDPNTNEVSVPPSVAIPPTPSRAAESTTSAPIMPEVPVDGGRNNQPAGVPVMPEVAPIQPAAPIEPTHEYLGSNPAMQDQVYPPQANDPGAFKIPGQ